MSQLAARWDMTHWSPRYEPVGCCLKKALFLLSFNGFGERGADVDKTDVKLNASILDGHQPQQAKNRHSASMIFL